VTSGLRDQGFEGSRVQGADASPLEPSNPGPLEPFRQRTQIIALVGPTASGKTELGIALAERFDAEIVNADSRQVYRHLDIGSAKPTAEQQARVRHHLIDVVDPSEQFECARYRELALAAIADITRRGKRVLVVGGTGLYVKVLLRGVFEGPSRDTNLRSELELEESQMPGSLHHRLAGIDPAAAQRLHPNDRPRLIRAIEVYELTGKPMSAWQDEHRFRQRELDTLTLALSLPRASHQRPSQEQNISHRRVCACRGPRPGAERCHDTKSRGAKRAANFATHALSRRPRST